MAGTNKIALMEVQDAGGDMDMLEMEQMDAANGEYEYPDSPKEKAKGRAEYRKK